MSDVIIYDNKHSSFVIILLMTMNYQGKTYVGGFDQNVVETSEHNLYNLSKNLKLYFVLCYIRS